MKIRFLLIISLLGAGLTPAFSQNRLSLGVTAAPVLNVNRSNVTFTVPGVNGQRTDTTFSLRSSVGGFSAGLSLQYAIGSAWSLSTGLWLNQLRSTQPFPFTSANVVSRVITTAYQIPLLLHYRPTARRLSPYFSAGALGHRSVNTRYKPIVNAGLTDTKVNFGKSLTVQALIGAGVTYRLTPRWSLMVQPLFIWRFPPGQRNGSRYNQYVSYQMQGQAQVTYSL